MKASRIAEIRQETARESGKREEMGRMAVAAIVTLWVIPISIAVNRIVPDPYMDEIFHIPQAQRYCRGDFKTWDPMITTPPGLYYLSLAYVAYLFPGLWFAKGTRSFPELCSTAYLRSTNSVMALICSVLIYDLIISLRPSLSDKKATVSAVVLALYPLHWFFTFLYYTDVASLTVVLAMYLASLKRQFLASAMLGAFATLLRQTNVVWMVFVAATGAISYVEDLCKKYNVNWVDYKSKAEEIDEVSDKKSISVNSNLRKRGMGTSKSPTKFPYSRVIYFHPLNDSGLINEIMDVSLKFWHFKSNVLITFFPYLVVFASFIAFVAINGGIVLGAKEAHVVSNHFVQLLYFGLAAAAAMAPAHFTFGRALGLCQSLRRNKIVSSFKLVIFMATGLILVHFFSIAHPYLLADNRHYTFYIWRKVIQAHWSMRYLLVPLYLYSWFSLTTALGKAQKKVWVLLLFFASALVLIPAPLIEFRYYTIPFYFLFLNSQIEENMNLVIIGIMYTSVDIITTLVFLLRPFHWDHELGMQRFIW